MIMVLQAKMHTSAQLPMRLAVLVLAGLNNRAEFSCTSG
jgi:hypothetical protein